MAEKMFQLMSVYDEHRRTIGIYNDVNDLFKTVRDKNLEPMYLEVYEIVSGMVDRQLQLVWNNCALMDNSRKTIKYVAKGFEDSIEVISDLMTKLNALRASTDEKLIMLKSLMNLNAKNTKAPASMALLLTSYISLHEIKLSCEFARGLMDSKLYLDKLRNQVMQQQYIHHMLDEWIVDCKAETGFDGELSELVKEEKYGKTPAITFP